MEPEDLGDCDEVAVETAVVAAVEIAVDVTAVAAAAEAANRARVTIESIDCVSTVESRNRASSGRRPPRPRKRDRNDDELTSRSRAAARRRRNPMEATRDAPVAT